MLITGYAKEKALARAASIWYCAEKKMLMMCQNQRKLPNAHSVCAVCVVCLSAVCVCVCLTKWSGACGCAMGSVVGSTGAFIFPVASLPRTIFKNSILLNIEALSCSCSVWKRERQSHWMCLWELSNIKDATTKIAFLQRSPLVASSWDLVNSSGDTPHTLTQY